MSNKDFYKALGIKKGDTLSLRQIIQIAQMRTHCETEDVLVAAIPGAETGRVDSVHDHARETFEVYTDQDIVEAVYALSPDVQDHWTVAGLPSMKAIETLVGSNTVRRSDIERLLPDYNRTSAKG